jgi:histone deacetylase 11
LNLFSRIYPCDEYAKGGIAFNVFVDREDNDSIFLDKVRFAVKDSIEKFNPEFIVYNAGTDCMENDPLGGLSLTREGIIKRDEIIFEFALNNHVPILMVLSGGYQKSTAPVISDSIENLVKKFNFL